MNYEEVRLAFLGYYEKRLKLQLLQAELQNIISDAQTMMVREEQMDTHYTTNSFNLTVIETVLIDTYAITYQRPDLLKALMGLRNAARSINNSIQTLLGVVHMPLSNLGQIVRRHNEQLRGRCPLLIDDANRALKVLETVLAA
jgi:hypothetical protein